MLANPESFAREGSPVTPDEPVRLTALVKRKATAAEVARILGRRVGSVRRQAKQLGIVLYKTPQKGLVRQQRRTGIGEVEIGPTLMPP
jgi:hypothetical protein